MGEVEIIEESQRYPVLATSRSPEPAL